MTEVYATITPLLRVTEDKRAKKYGRHKAYLRVYTRFHIDYNI